MRSLESSVVNCRTFNISDEPPEWGSNKRRSGLTPSLRSEAASEYPGVSMTLCPSSSRTDRAMDRVTGLAVIRTARRCFTCTFRKRHSALAMWDESSNRLTFPDGQSFANAVPLSSGTKLRPCSPTQQLDRASPMQSHSAAGQSFAYAVPLSSGTELRLWQSQRVLP